MNELAPEISISVINTNNREIALQCLESIYANLGSLNLEVILVNNACTDGSTAIIRQRYPQVEIIEHEQLLGFSTNNNLALQRARGRYLMILNDDTIILPGAFQAMVAFMDQNPQAGVAGAALLNRDGSAQYCYDFIPNPLYEGLRPISEYLMPHPDGKGKPLETGYVGGACLMARASAVRTVGLLDTRFDPLYSEEVDWCYRFKKDGWKIYHLPQAQVIHLGEVLARRSSPARYERIYAQKTVFFRKHYGEFGAWSYKLTLWVVNLAKAVTWRLLDLAGKKEAPDEFKTHWKIVQRALKF